MSAKDREEYFKRLNLGTGKRLSDPGLLGLLYDDKERLDFVFTIYHWWQAIAIFVVYLWSNLAMRVKLSILLLALLLAMCCYWHMEKLLTKRVPFRLPRIPRPRHKVKGYRYLEEENSDESGSEQSGDEQEEEDEEIQHPEAEDVVEGEGSRARGAPAYEQAGRREEYDGYTHHM